MLRCYGGLILAEIYSKFCINYEDRFMSCNDLLFLLSIEDGSLMLEALVICSENSTLSE